MTQAQSAGAYDYLTKPFDNEQRKAGPLIVVNCAAAPETQ